MSKSYLMQKLHTYKPTARNKMYVAGLFVSEKVDGIRGLWDGGVTTGLPKDNSIIPWAHTDKDDRYKNPQICTGFWSQNGNVIHAPKWLVDSMPKVALDFEFYCPEMTFNEISSVVRQDNQSDPRWKYISCYVFNIVPINALLSERKVKEPHCKLSFDGKAGFSLFEGYKGDFAPRPFLHTYSDLMSHLKDTSPRVIVHNQIQLPANETEARAALGFFADNLFASSKEGVVITSPAMTWTPERNPDILKYKASFDAEATITGFITADEGKLLGKIGAINLVKDGKTFQISGTGLRETEADFDTYEAQEWAKAHPKQQLPDEYDGYILKRGRLLTYTYRKLTPAGIPAEARYKRGREIE